jgi:hypothetical protein
MEGRIETNGNQEKGKKEKEALTKSVRSRETGDAQSVPQVFAA